MILNMSKNPKDVVITSALRTPIGGYRGALKNLSAAQLGSLVIKEVINKSKLNVDEIDEVIMGHVLTAGLGQNPARQASIGAGVPVSKPAHIVNQVCGSGLRSVVSAYQSIQLGENKIVIAGGQENMSRATHAIFYREDKKFSENKLVDTMINDGLVDAFNNYHMGVTAENIAEKFNISREEQDNFSLNSQKKTKQAYSENKFKDELIKLQIKDGDKNFTFEKDDGIGEPKSFAAGADISEFSGKNSDDVRPKFENNAWERVWNLSKPTIAMVDGFALGGGTELALSCDIRIASEESKFGQPEINLGLIPGGGGTQRLTQLVGYGVSMEMILTGGMITAERAKDIGLVNRVVPSSELMNVTLDIATEIGKKSPAVLKVAKRAVRSALDLPVSQGILAERSEFVALFDTEDTTIGVEAFLSKNKPEWVGR